MYAPGESRPATKGFGELKRSEFYLDVREKTSDAQKTFGLLKDSWQKQTNDMDKKTRFIYRCHSVEEVREKIKELPQKYKDYAIRRYFNKTVSQTAEEIFCSYNICEKEPNKFHRYIDFRILGVPFDLKVSSYPARFKYLRSDFRTEREYRNALIYWLYKNQSREQRHHYKNRLFILCKKGNGKIPKANNQLKTRLDLIDQQVHNFLNYSLSKYYKGEKVFNDLVIDGYHIFSDIILIED